MPRFIAYSTSIFALAAAVCTAIACGSSNTISGEIQFHRDVDLPDGATVTVKLQDTSFADASAIELGRDVIENVDSLPVRFSIEYDSGQIEGQAEITLSARVEVGGELLYINDTVHPVLTRGNPRNSDVRVISISEFDQCVESLPGQIHSSFWERPMHN